MAERTVSPMYERFPVLGLGLGFIGKHDLPAFDRPMAEGLLDYAEPFAAPLFALDNPTSHVPEGLDLLLHAASLSPASSDAIPQELLAEHRRIGTDLRVHWMLEDVATWRLDGDRPVGEPFWPPIFDEQSLALLIERMRVLPYAVDRPVLCEFMPLRLICGPIPPPEFFRRLAEGSGCGLVLDLSHWIVYCEQVGLDPLASLPVFPLEHVIELHVAGGVRVGGRYSEEHSADLLPDIFELLSAACEVTPNLRAITVECHTAGPDIVYRSVSAVAALPSVQALRARRTGAEAAALGASEVEVREAIELVGRPGPEDLHRRERVARLLYQQPQFVDNVFSGRVALDSRDHSLVFAHSREAWLVAGRGVMRQFPQETLSRRACLALAVGTADPGIAMQRFMASRPIDADFPVASELLEFLIECDAVADWARELLRFELEVARVSAGEDPCGPFERNGSVIEIRFDRPVIETFRSLALERELPDAAPTLVRMRVEDGRLKIDERPDNEHASAFQADARATP